MLTMMLVRAAVIEADGLMIGSGCRAIAGFYVQLLLSTCVSYVTAISLTRIRLGSQIVAPLCIIAQNQLQLGGGQSMTSTGQATSYIQYIAAVCNIFRTLCNIFQTVCIIFQTVCMHHLSNGMQYLPFFTSHTQQPAAATNIEGVLLCH